MNADLESHRRFLNAYYGKVKHVYDATRKYYLFGRDRALDVLLTEAWATLVEVGPGTGRNLARMRRMRRSARYGGIEASDAMLEVARQRCPWASIIHGFAEEADFESVLGTRPQRILFSYCLSMVQDQARAVANARDSLAAGGRITIVDFGDMSTLPGFAPAMRRFLGSFHVAPPDLDLLREHGAQVTWGPGRYYLIATIPGNGPSGDDTR
ncbi:MAG: class I SAM-dependent methyltransferase [Gemmatimonadota bacterium]